MTATDPVERFFYAASVLHRLPVGRCAQRSAATGTVMRPDVPRGHAAAAGFGQFSVLPTANDVFRSYRLEG